MPHTPTPPAHGYDDAPPSTPRYPAHAAPRWGQPTPRAITAVERAHLRTTLMLAEVLRERRRVANHQRRLAALERQYGRELAATQVACLRVALETAVAS